MDFRNSRARKTDFGETEPDFWLLGEFRGAPERGGGSGGARRGPSTKSVDYSREVLRNFGGRGLGGLGLSGDPGVRDKS